MRSRRWSLCVISAAILFLAGCGGVSTNVQNPPPPPPSPLAIAFEPQPPGSIPVNTTTDLTAVVRDDPGNYGVDWSITCNAAKCGSLSFLHTASGDPVTYTPPETLPGNSLSVNIVAFAAADHTRNAAAQVSVTAFGGGLSGTYVFQTKGVDLDFQPYELAGAIVLDGNGGISAGEQVRNSASGSLRTSINPSSTYFLGGDGRGTITINTNDQDGAPLTESFSLVVLSDSKALLAELDAPQSSVGTLDLQASTVAPTGGYAFVVSGIDPFGTPTAFGGVLNIDSPGNISGAGSLADQDYNNFLASCTAPKGLIGTVSEPDAAHFGSVKFDLTGANCFGTIQFTGYIVDSTHIALIETDNNGSSGFSTSGIAISQETEVGTFTSASFVGTYVFGILGNDFSSGLPSSLISVGVLNPDGAGTVPSGITDTFLMSDINGLPVQINSFFDGTYDIDTKGIGRVRASFKDFDPAPRPAYRPLFIFYLTGTGKPALVLDSGGKDPNYPSLGAGIAYPREPGSRPLSGKYGVSFTQQNGTENDGTGRMTADASATPRLSGLVDDTNQGIGSPLALSDTFSSADSQGRIPGTFMGFAARYYPIDADFGFIVETDLADPIVPTGQINFGTYARRTPICDGCP